MVACSQCATPNSIDGSFCKKCGNPLLEDDLLMARERVAGWLHEGDQAYRENRIDEALAIAESALESDLSSLAALTLKSLCLERMGQIAEALEIAEKVVELNPDSELDRIRRNKLRSILGSPLVVDDRDRSKLRMAAAFAAFALCLFTGVAISLWWSHREVQASVADNSAAHQAPIKSFGNVETTITPPATGAKPSTVPSVSPPVTNTFGPNQVVPKSTDPTDVAPIQSRTPIDLPNYDGTRLPNPNGEIGGGDIQLKPVSPTPDTAIQPAQVTSDSKTNTDPQPLVETTSAPVAPKVEDPGQISITVHPRGAPKTFVGGSDSVESPKVDNGADALFRTGTQQFLSQNYGAAATSFEKSLKAGGSPITVNQRLAQSYEKLGKNNEAVAAYSRAAQACKDAIAFGTGNKSHLSAVLDSCEQAIKVLGH